MLIDNDNDSHQLYREAENSHKRVIKYVNISLHSSDADNVFYAIFSLRLCLSLVIILSYEIVRTIGICCSYSHLRCRCLYLNGVCLLI